MKRTALAALVAGLAATAPTPAVAAAMGEPIRFDQRFALQPSTTATYRMNISALGKDKNVLIPCWGFSIEGPGIDLTAAGLRGFGPVYAEPGIMRDPPDGGHRDAVRQPDGSYAVPESAAIVTAEHLFMGRSCRSVGWDFYGADGRARLDSYYNPFRAAGPRSSKASKRLRARRLRAARRRVKGRVARDGPVAVTLAGLTLVADRSQDLVVTVRTGALPGPTTLTTHARVLAQR